jgi:hypothetical protein
MRVAPVIGVVAAGSLAVSGLAAPAGASVRHPGAHRTPPFVSLFSTSAHTVRFEVSLNKFHDSGFRKYEIYLLHGRKAPKRLLHHQPSRSPDLSSTHRSFTTTIHHLKTFKAYNAVAYAYFKGGEVEAADSNPGIPVDYGYHVVGQKQYVKNALSGSLAVDRKGGLHVLASVRPLFARGEQAKLTYATRAAGASRWTMRQDGTIEDTGHASFALGLSPDGSHIEALVSACRGVLTAQTPVSAKTMPPPAALTTYQDCYEYDDHTVTVRGMATAPGNHAVLVGQVTSDTTTTASYFTGSPGGTFTSHAFPGGEGQFVDAIVRDEITGQLTAWGESSQHHLEVWDQKAGGDWIGPTPVPDLPAGAHITERLRIASWNGELFATLDKVGDGDKLGGSDTMFLATRAKDGTWSAYQKLPHTTRFDGGPLPYVDPADGHLHVVWTRSEYKCEIKCSGLMHEKLVDGKWTKPQRLTRWYGDVATNVVVSKQGHLVVGYLRG